jgi:L-fuconolactonase
VSIVDAHVHVWDPRVLTYPWLADAGAAAAPHLPEAIDRADGRSTRMVFVQADCLPEQSVAEMRWVAESAWPELAGIVAAADLRDATLNDRLDELASAGPLRGIRHLLQGEPVERFAEPALRRGLETLAARELPFDACVRHEQLDALADLLERVPALRVVLDHIGKPPVAEGIDSEPGRAWRAAIERIAALPEAYVKLSGLIPEAPDEQTLRRNGPAFVQAALAAFGPDRAMLGSDWPVSGIWGPDIGFAAWVDLVRAQTADDASWDAVASGSATRFYRLDATA